MSNENLTKAKKAKNDEFYTQYKDIEEEIKAYIEYNPDVFRDKVILCPCDDPEWSNFTKYFTDHFEELGIKRLISTCYNEGGHGKLLVKDRNKTIKQELQGDGDFRSQEVSVLRDQADFIITNPPFSLFREFVNWIWCVPSLQFLVIGNMNAITYKEIFPKIKNNKMWTGNGFNLSLVYKTPYPNTLESNKKVVKKKGYNPDDGYVIVPAICWFTNIDHGRRHQPLQLMTATENLRLSKHDAIKGKTFEEAYPKYDNYEAINVDFTDAIPKDYDGVMGVPISFLDKYCPDQFEIIDLSRYLKDSKGMTKKFIDDYYAQGNKGQIKEGHPDLCYYTSTGKAVVPYMRILIRKK